MVRPANASASGCLLLENNASITRSHKSIGIVYHAPEVVTDTASRDAYQEMLHKKLES
jgi:hypothetical protein